MIRLLKNFLADQSGATAIEYGLIVSLIALAILPATSALGSKLKTTFSEVTGNLK